MVSKNHNVGISWLLNSSIPKKSVPIVPFGSCCSSNCLHSITRHSPRSCIWNLGLQSKEFIKGCHGQKFLGRVDCGGDEGEKRAEKRGPKVAISWSGKECVQPLLKHTCREKGKDVPGGNDSRFTNFLEIALQHRGNTLCGRVALLICTSQPI